MVTVGVVGIGNWGKNLVRCFAEEAEVAYCCHTGSAENADWVSTRYPEVTRTTSYRRVLRDETVDAVVVATPVGTHAELAEQALKADKHVFVEKPLATDERSAHELVALSNERGCKLFTGFVFLYAPAIRELFERTRDEEVAYVQSRWEKFGSFDSPIEQSLVCHDVAIGKQLFRGEFDETSVTRGPGLRSDCDVASVTLETPDGRTMVGSYDRFARRKRKSLVVVTERGTRYEFENDRLFARERGEYEEVVSPSDGEPLVAECKAFLRWVTGGREPPSTGSFAANVVGTVAGL